MSRPVVYIYHIKRGTRYIQVTVRTTREKYSVFIAQQQTATERQA